MIRATIHSSITFYVNCKWIGSKISVEPNQHESKHKNLKTSQTIKIQDLCSSKKRKEICNVLVSKAEG